MNMTGTLGRKVSFSAFVVVGNKNGIAGEQFVSLLLVSATISFFPIFLAALHCRPLCHCTPPSHAHATLLAFLAHDSIYAIARSLLSPVRLSVCLAVCLSVRHTGGSVKDGSR